MFTRPIPDSFFSGNELHNDSNVFANDSNVLGLARNV